MDFNTMVIIIDEPLMEKLGVSERMLQGLVEHNDGIKIDLSENHQSSVECTGPTAVKAFAAWLSQAVS